ncbi:DUF4468 domain-containing protein [Pedobacter sp. NJ-S-72]
MKKIMLSLLLIAPFIGLAQQVPIDSATKKITYTGVVEAPGTKSQLFDRTLEWFATSFKSANDVIQVKDKVAGKFVGSLIVYVSEGGPVSSSNIVILVKDGKYKYTITDLVFNGGGSFKPWALESDPSPFKVGMMKKGIKHIKENSFVRVENLILSLKTKMAINDTKASDF